MKNGISLVYILGEDHEQIRQINDSRSVIGVAIFNDGKLQSASEDTLSNVFGLKPSLVMIRELTELLAKALNKPFNEFAIHLPQELNGWSYLELNAAIDNNDWYQLERAV